MADQKAPQMQATLGLTGLTAAGNYFAVQGARGRLAGLQDAASKAEELLRRVEALSAGLVPEVETDRARALLADLNQQAISTRTAWSVASAGWLARSG